MRSLRRRLLQLFRKLFPRKQNAEDTLVSPASFHPLPLHRSKHLLQKVHSPRGRESVILARKQQGTAGNARHSPVHPLMENSRVVVTGGAGFIGSALIRALNQRGITQILVVDALGKDERWRNLAPLRFEDVILPEDFYRRIERESGFYGDFQNIFHLGACSSTTERDADYLLRNNYECSKMLCLWSASIDARFVYASSAATYGDGSQGMSDTSDMGVLRPLNMYGYSKQLFDQWVYREKYLSYVVGLKYFNVYGPNEFHKDAMRSLVCKAYDQIRESGKLQLFRSYRSDYRDGEQVRDFVYVKDAVAMTLFLAEHPRAGGLYNVGAGVARTWLDLARAIFKALDLPEKVEFIEMPEHIRKQYQYHTLADMRRIRDLGYQRPPYSLETAIDDYVRNYLVPHTYLGDEDNQKALQFPVVDPAVDTRSEIWHGSKPILRTA